MSAVSILRQPWENLLKYLADPYLNFKNILFFKFNLSMVKPLNNYSLNFYK